MRLCYLEVEPVHVRDVCDRSPERIAGRNGDVVLVVAGAVVLIEIEIWKRGRAAGAGRTAYGQGVIAAGTEACNTEDIGAWQEAIEIELEFVSARSIRTGKAPRRTAFIQAVDIQMRIKRARTVGHAPKVNDGRRALPRRDGETVIVHRIGSGMAVIYVPDILSPQSRKGMSLLQ